MKFMVLALCLSAVLGCAAPSTSLESSAAEPAEMLGEVSQASIVCATASDCPWEWKQCQEAVCVAGFCAVAQRATGTQCTSGVGVCLANGTCKAPVGACKPQDAPSVCRTSADCVDQMACTWGECVGAECHYTQDSNGGPCTISGGACNWGACCEMPGGACIQPVRSPPTCSSSDQCDDHDNCTWDSCELGLCQHSAHPNGTYCDMGAGVDGQCLGGACCFPTSACDLPWITPKPPGIAQCTVVADCDDHDSCTDDTCSIGSCYHAAHADGSTCSRVSGGSGHCLSAQCCSP